VSTELRDIAVLVAREAGELLRARRGERPSGVETKSSPTDMVSDVDRAAEALIRSRLATLRVGDGFFGEEAGRDQGRTGVRWIVDPLDGTTNYLYGFPVWAVSVAAEVHGVVSAGAVFDPIHDECFSAALGEGARCNDTALGLGGEPVALAQALVGTGFAYTGHERTAQAGVAARVLPRVRDLRRAGAAALDLCWVAAGRLDAYYESGVQLWDWAAGALVAAEAGAIVCGINGGDPGPSGIVASRPELVDALLALLRPL